MRQLEATDAPNYGSILGALTQLSQREPNRFNSRLLTLVKPQLTNTNKFVSEFTWRSGRRTCASLRPDLERLAT